MMLRVFSPILKPWNFSPVLKVLGVVVRVRESVEITSVDSLGFIPFSDRNRLESRLPFSHPRVSSDKVGEVCPLSENLLHPRVVIVILGHMTIRAALGLRGSDRMRKMRRKGLTAVPSRRNRRLLHIDTFTIRVF